MIKIAKILHKQTHKGGNMCKTQDNLVLLEEQRVENKIWGWMLFLFLFDWEVALVTICASSSVENLSLSTVNIPHLLQVDVNGQCGTDSAVERV